MKPPLCICHIKLDEYFTSCQLCVLSVVHIAKRLWQSRVRRIRIQITCRQHKMDSQPTKLPATKEKSTICVQCLCKKTSDKVTSFPSHLDYLRFPGPQPKLQGRGHWTIVLHSVSTPLAPPYTDTKIYCLATVAVDSAATAIHPAISNQSPMPNASASPPSNTCVKTT